MAVTYADRVTHCIKGGEGQGGKAQRDGLSLENGELENVPKKSRSVRN